MRWSCAYPVAMTVRTAFLGFGEAANAFASDERWAGDAIGYDLKLDDPGTRSDTLSDFQTAGVEACTSCADAVAAGDQILSLVTADQSLNAARTASGHLRAGTLFFDMNSVAPQRKREAATLIEAAGGRYVDVAVMSPVYPAQLDVPLLVSGPHAEDGEQALGSLGFSKIRQAGAEIGRASVIKMVRSVMVKGIEALTAECVLAADAAGVTDEVLASLGAEWPGRANYNLERMLVHGNRRAAEMEEVCATLESLGIQPELTRGTVRRQRELGQLGHHTPPDRLEDKLSLISGLKEVRTA